MKKQVYKHAKKLFDTGSSRTKNAINTISYVSTNKKERDMAKCKREYIDKRINKHLKSYLREMRKCLKLILQILILLALILPISSDTPTKNKALENLCKIVDTDT